VKLTVACPSPPLAETPVGVPGTWAGVTVFDAAEAEPVPALLVALTVNVYAVPFVSPVTVIGLAEPEAVAPQRPRCVHCGESLLASAFTAAVAAPAAHARLAPGRAEQPVQRNPRRGRRARPAR
jgi:hypothetical protein